MSTPFDPSFNDSADGSGRADGVSGGRSSPDDAPAEPRGSERGRVLVVGTASTCRQVLGQLNLLATAAIESTNGHLIVPIGCVLTDLDAGEPRAWPILGGIEQLSGLCASLKPSSALVCLPRQARGVSERIAAILGEHGILRRNVPTLEDVFLGPLLMDPTSAWGRGESARGSPEYRIAPAPVARDAGAIDIESLIGRSRHQIDRAAVAKLIQGRRVLITGAGGSIGSEIARICAGFAPERLILMERSENALFEIDRQIASRFPGVSRKSVLHDVVDSESTLRHLVETRPDVVFHAAAHKHVPLMEDHPAHAVTNNFFGTKSIADASLAVGVERFVLISSDKAVNPTSVMGATKRLAEMYIQGLHRSAWRGGRGASGQGAGANTLGHGSSAATCFCMVRFGNVLGSACSVLPIWSSQIAEGGPITVTDPRMTRYFMTIPEAAALVIQAGAIDSREPTAAVYVLDMGQPIRILNMACRFVRSRGYQPRVVNRDGTPHIETVGAVDADVASGEDSPGRLTPEMLMPLGADLPTMTVTLTGARPGEKLHEELAYAVEMLRPTCFSGINSWSGPLRDDFSLAALVSDMSAARIAVDRAAVIEAIRRHVPQLTGSTIEPRDVRVVSESPDAAPVSAR